MCIVLTYSQAVRKQIAGRSDAQMKYVTLTVDERVEMIWKHFCHVCRDVPIGDNYYMCMYLTGSRSVMDPVPQHCLPPYLTKEGFTCLKVT